MARVGKDTFNPRRSTMLFVLVIAVVGVATLQFTKGLSPSIMPEEAESARLDGAYEVISDSAASNNQAVRLGVQPVSSCDGEQLAPTTDIQAYIDGKPAGTTYCLTEGTYREFTAQPKDGDSFVGVGQVILTGAKVLEGFTAEGEFWMIASQTQEGYVHGQCLPEAPRCMYPEDLFVDGVPLKHVATKTDLAPGAWFFDYAANVIYIGQDPTGRLIETSTQRHAFHGYVNSVSIRNVIVEKYANPAQSGAIMAGFGPGLEATWLDGWKIDAVEARYNHAAGVAFSYNNGFSLTNSKLMYNGQQGINGSTGKNTVIKDNEIAFNNNLRFDYEWEGGGTKFQGQDNILISGNHSHDNYGPGLWTDIDNRNVVYDTNQVDNNRSAGIFHEISYNAIIKNNSLTGNGIDDHDWCYGAAIQVSASQNVEVFGNVLKDNARSIVGISQDRGADYSLKNLYVHDNRTTNESVTGSITGICRDNTAEVYAAAANNKFAANQYFNVGQSWMWQQDLGSNWSAWQATGNDTDGGFALP